jgi:hypothetical protein
VSRHLRTQTLRPSRDRLLRAGAGLQLPRRPSEAEELCHVCSPDELVDSEGESQLSELEDLCAIRVGEVGLGRKR